MIPWAKMASDLDLDPAIIRAGRNGREVYLLLLRRCALGDSRGFVSARHLDPEVIARILMCSAAEAQEGIDACLRESLVAIDDGGARVGGELFSYPEHDGRDSAIWTYAIQRQQGGQIKIGRSSSPRSRLAALQTSSPDKLVLLRSIRGDHESAAHAALAKYRIRGEWFRKECLYDMHSFLDQMEAT